MEFSVQSINESTEIPNALVDRAPSLVGFNESKTYYSEVRSGYWVDSATPLVILLIELAR